MIPTIAISNKSQSVSDAQLAAILPSLQTQISRDFLPFWGVDAKLILSSVEGIPAGAWQCMICEDDDTTSNDLGFHVDDSGTPTAKIFAAEDIKYGASLSVTISHELLEMLADPIANGTFAAGDVTYMREVADPVEADADGYEIDGVQVSNFATPRYFGLQNPDNDPRYDFRGLLQAGIPTLRPGGYCMFFRDGTWQSTMARLADGSLGRRATRSRGRSYFRASRNQV